MLSGEYDGIPARSHERIRKLGGHSDETLREKLDRAIENLEDIEIYLRELREEIE